ncbi:MAG TPA: LAGLIDADG family homing endonuclease, partial [Hyphomicrobiaceae bacterium]|nr:LAGLIDADG family homing endonuclease [Hyphomicrobiaceae bacterium]
MAAEASEKSSISQEIWDLKYRLKGADGTPLEATIEDTWRRVARAAAGAERGGKRTRAAWAERFYAGMADLGFLPAGRIIAGAGTGRRVTLFNCFVMGRIEDDLASIFENVKEAALTMQQGGGIGHDFSTLRPKGAPVKSTGADASGPVSFMDVWDAMCRTIMSAGHRRGAMMGTMRCDHPDIEEFIAAKADPRRLRNFNLSVLVSDAFLAAVREDKPWNLMFDGHIVRTVKARELWERLMRATYDYAEPGVIFIDRINRDNNLAYCEEIHTTNPCVTADTWVQTHEGPRQVADLIGRTFVARVDGEDWRAEGGFFATGRRPVVRLRTKEGHTLRLTSDHKLLAVAGLTRYRRETCWREAGSLRAGDLLVLNDHRSRAEWGGVGSFEEGFLLGLLVGDGTLKKEAAVLSVWKPPRVANGPADAVADGVEGLMERAEKAARTLPHRADFRGWCEVAGRSEWRLKLAALRDLAGAFGMTPEDKCIGPLVERTSSDFHRGLLRGLFDTDGSVQGNQLKGASVRLAQSSLAHLEAAQRMLLRLGIASMIYTHRRGAGVRKLPDGKGGVAIYPTAPQHELVIAGDNLAVFAERVGFSDRAKEGRLAAILTGYARALNRERFCAEVLSVEPDGEADVYDVTIPGRNAFDANGLVAHNCGEQPLPPYGACLLGSINLAQFVNEPFAANAAMDIAKVEERARIAVRFLDNVIDISDYPLPAQRHEAISKRRIGLGVTGLADALIMLGVRYGSQRAQTLAAEWMAAIERAAYLASAELAAEKGSFPLYDAEQFLSRPNVLRLDPDVRAALARHGIRNGCLTSIAPTGTISLLAGNVSSGIEPVFDFEFDRAVRGPDGTVRHHTVTDYAYRLYRTRFGPEAPLPDTFVTAAQLSPRAHLQMQAALQRHVDSSISKTINCPPDIAFEAFKDVYLEAYELGLKGCTTFRPNAVTGAVLTASLSSAAPGADQGAAVAPRTGHPAGPRPAGVPPAQVASAEAAPDDGAAVVYMAKPLERDPALAGFTYKLKWPSSDHAIYVTINDIERDGRRRPFEIFINTKNLEHYAWTVALTRMISAVFRRGGDVAFVVEELKAVFDPQGGHWVNGRYVPSLLAAIGEVIEAHMMRTGFLQPAERTAGVPEAGPEARVAFEA